MTNTIIELIIYLLISFIGIIAALFLFAFVVSFIKVWLRRDSVTLKKVSELTEEERELLKETLRKDPRNWIQLHIEKNGDTLYFYDRQGNGENDLKFLFQCRTYEDMLSNLESIRGNRGVKVDANLVQSLQLEEFFDKPGVRLEERKGENIDESV